MKLKQTKYLTLILAILLSSCVGTKNTISQSIPASTALEMVTVGDCYQNTDLGINEYQRMAFVAGVVSSVLLPIAVNYSLEAVSSYIKKRETKKSAVSTAIAFRQSINPKETNPQCLIFVRGKFGEREDINKISIEKRELDRWKVDDIKAIYDRGIPLLDVPEVYVELYLDSYQFEASDDLIAKRETAKKQYEAAVKLLDDKRNETDITPQQLETFKEERDKTHGEWLKAKSKVEYRNYYKICPRPTYVDYLYGGTKTNTSGEKKISFTPSFFTSIDGKRVQFYSHAFDLGARKPGLDPLTHKSNQLFPYLDQDKKPSMLLPCFVTESGIENMFVNAIYLETEDKSDFNLAIADAIASEATQKAVLSLVQDELKSDTEKTIDEANALIAEKEIRTALVCDKSESLSVCVERVRREENIN